MTSTLAPGGCNEIRPVIPYTTGYTQFSNLAQNGHNYGIKNTNFDF